MVTSTVNTEYEAYFRVPTKIISQDNAIAALGSELSAAGVSKVVVITDSGLHDSEILQRAGQSLGDAGMSYEIRVVDEPDPTVRTIDAIAAEATQSGFDAVVGLGGGSSLDIAKGVSIAMSTKSSIADSVGTDKASPRTIGLAAVPTTIGTGSEVSWHISVRDDERQLKLTVRSVNACPDLAILDPLAVKSLPTRIAAITASDSFTHSYESFLSTKGRWLLTDSLAGGAISAICQSLKPYLENPGDVEAATAMLEASCLGGITLSHARTGIVHQMARPLGAQCRVPHGLANAILLPRVLEHTWEGIVDRLSQMYPFVQQLDVQPLSEDADERKRAERTKSLIVAFFSSLDIPHSLTEAGVHSVSISSLVEDALQGQDRVTNPCVVERDGLEAIYTACV